MRKLTYFITTEVKIKNMQGSSSNRVEKFGNTRKKARRDGEFQKDKRSDKGNKPKRGNRDEEYLDSGYGY